MATVQKKELRTVVAKLEALRRRKALTRAAFGYWLGYRCRTGWQNVVKGHKKISRATWIRIRIKTGIPLARLIGRES